MKNVFNTNTTIKGSYVHSVKKIVYSRKNKTKRVCYTSIRFCHLILVKYYKQFLLFKLINMHLKVLYSVCTK